MNKSENAGRVVRYLPPADAIDLTAGAPEKFPLQALPPMLRDVAENMAAVYQTTVYSVDARHCESAATRQKCGHADEHRSTGQELPSRSSASRKHSHCTAPRNGFERGERLLGLFAPKIARPNRGPPGEVRARRRKNRAASRMARCFLGNLMPLGVLFRGAFRWVKKDCDLESAL